MRAPILYEHCCCAKSSVAAVVSRSLQGGKAGSKGGTEAKKEKRISA